MILFSPGPSNISERVRRALLAPDIGHREPEFGVLQDDVRNGLRKVTGLAPESPHSVVLFSGSGSVAIESVVAACRSLGRLLVIANGPYGERAAAMARHHGVDVDEWRLGWGDAIAIDALEARLKEARFGAVHVVHHETATGRLNPLREIAAAAMRHGALVLADTISSIVGEPIDIAGWGLDAVLGSANKCLRGVPGAAFAIVSPAFRAAAAKQRGQHYSNLELHAAAQEQGEFPFTPPVHAMFALREAIAETLDEGIPARQAHYADLARRTLDGLAAAGVATLLDRAAYGHTLIGAHLPKGWTYDALHGSLKAKGYCIYAAQGALRSSAFRVGLIGHFGADAVEGLFREMRAVLAR